MCPLYSHHIQSSSLLQSFLSFLTVLFVPLGVKTRTTVTTVKDFLIQHRVPADKCCILSEAAHRDTMLVQVRFTGNTQMHWKAKLFVLATFVVAAVMAGCSQPCYLHDYDDFAKTVSGGLPHDLPCDPTMSEQARQQIIRTAQ